MMRFRLPDPMLPFLLGGVLFSVLVIGDLSSADELTLTAEQLYAEGVADQVIPETPGGPLILSSGVLVEDDGPAAGYSYRANTETLAGDLWIKKQLSVVRPAARAATLLVGRGGSLQAVINGREVALSEPARVGNYWQAYKLDPAVLKAGLNDIVLHAAADADPQAREKAQLWIARNDEYAGGATPDRTPPNRSFKSIDGGKTWRDAELGEKNDVDGEYYVRLQLDQYQPRGTLTLPVLDAGNLQRKQIGHPATKIGPIQIKVQLADVSSGKVRLRVRTGKTFAERKEGWTDWQGFASGEANIATPSGRFLQVQVVFETDDPLQTPKLSAITISAQPELAEDWSAQWKITSQYNPPLLRSPVPFEYEPFDSPQLAKLRQQEKLDDVVKGAVTQFDQACKLAVWSAQRWPKLGHLGEAYPAWNALEILKPHADGTPVGGFCQQYNLVFLQACLSLGLTVRAISVGPGNMSERIRSGHETVELWSNDHRKWVYLDGNTGWYVKDQESGVPLSLWELRTRQLLALSDKPYPPVEIVKLVETRYDLPNLTSTFGFMELRYLPRNNFLSQPAPLPLNQGMRGWFWPGHWATGDGQTAATPLYQHHLVRQKDAEWTLNQAQIMLVAYTEPNALIVFVDSDTPGFQHYEVRYRDIPPQIVKGSSFLCDLRSGKNHIAVTPINILGQRGIETFVELEKTGD